MNYKIILLFMGIFLFACAKDNEDDINIPDPEEENEPIDSTEQADYFPAINSNIWEATDPSELNWEESQIAELYQLLEDNGTRAFIILINGKIVLEKYFGKDLLNFAEFKSSTNWYWASAGKTLTAFTVAKAQEDDYLKIADKSSDYLGTGWTSLTPEQEEKITIWHHLTMTTGLNDAVLNNHSFSPENLQFKAEAGSRWAYHNAPYTLLDQIVENATNNNFEDYFNNALRDPIGMDGFWSWVGDDHVFFSTARSMARFGLLMANKGTWNGQDILTDKALVSSLTLPSQNINNSYGYLWWLNGYENYMLPQSQIIFPGSLTPSAPDDMFSGIGKNGQYVSIIPSLDMVMVRMGENPDQVQVPLLFQEDIWRIMQNILPE